MRDRRTGALICSTRYVCVLKNVKLAEKMSEKALIVFWKFIMKNNLYEKNEEIETLIVLYKQYEECCENYLKEIK